MTTLEIILSAILFCSTAFTILLLTLPSRHTHAYKEPPGAAPLKEPGDKDASELHTPTKASVQVLVLGDIGRSPRMQYHALSIAKHGGRVDLIGYRESDPHPDLVSNPHVSIVPIPPPPPLLRSGHGLLFIVLGPLKVIWQVWSLWMILGYRTEPARWLLVQNPPAIPTLALAHLICFLRNTSLVIDWHNLGWSILAMKLGGAHPLVRVARWYERFFGRSAVANFTVTDVMATLLKTDYDIRSPILTLHDRPPAQFQPLSPEHRQRFLSGLPQTAQYAAAILKGDMRLIVSSTSWTPDEDFSILLDALKQYSQQDATYHQRPHILAIITGKGPLKEYHQQKMSESKPQLSKATISTAWLSAADYASLLGAADLGVSLHTSSSGVDLPMKVVDMLGAGLPVTGWSRFAAWPELIQEGDNGRGFGSAAELNDVLRDLLVEDVPQLSRLKEGALREGRRRWDDEWDPIAGRLFGLVA
ncbi:MAG: mannosyltransferase [Caeruleum heppii]|nr:MAG: mannosyltransferase [Caeruleum heppii]